MTFSRNLRVLVTVAILAVIGTPIALLAIRIVNPPPDNGTVVSKYHEAAWTETRWQCISTVDGSCTARMPVQVYHPEEWKLKIDDDGDGEAGWLDYVSVPQPDWESCKRGDHWQRDRAEGCAT